MQQRVIGPSAFIDRYEIARHRLLQEGATCVLRRLGQHDGVMERRHLATDSWSVEATIGRLVDDGLVEVEPSDAGERVALTNEGWTVLKYLKL